jgi:hypothetical protein
MQQH